MSKHTPGSWHFVPVQEWPFGVRVVAASDKVILSQHAICASTSQKTRADSEDGIGFPTRSDQFTTRAEAQQAIAEQDANARLIAAAPKMLEMLRECALQIAYLQNKFGNTGSGNAVLARIYEVLSEATEEAP